MGEGLGTVIAAIIGALATIYTTLSKQKEIEEIKDSFKLPVKIPSTDKRNSILLIGLGGTGKTSLIKALLNNHEANPNEKTENFEIYKGDRLSIKSNQEKNTENNRFWFYIADYKGQNIGQLVRSFIVQQKKPYSPLAYGYVTSLILIVDLFPPKDDVDDEDIKRQVKYNDARIKEHLLQWNDTALDAIFGLLTSELRYVNIFVNKVDLISDRKFEADERILKTYKDLEQKIKKRSGRATVKTYLGSARAGTSVNFLIEDLMEYSVYNSKDYEEKNYG